MEEEEEEDFQAARAVPLPTTPRPAMRRGGEQLGPCDAIGGAGSDGGEGKKEAEAENGAGLSHVCRRR